MILSRAQTLLGKTKNLESLQAKHPILQKLGGQWKDVDPKEYTSKVVSRFLENTIDKDDPTVGLIPAGHHEFYTDGNEEWMYGLEEGLEMGVGKGQPTIEWGIGERIIVPKKSWLIIDAPDDILYTCRYNAIID